MPKIFAFLNQKGGAGKSTTAGHFAYWLHSHQKTVLFVDADGQRSASPWMEALGLPVIAMNDPEALIDRLPVWATDYDAVVVDGPGNASEITKAILMRTDVVIIPNRPSDFDLRSSGAIAVFVRQAKEFRQGMPAACFFLNAAKGERSVLLREAQELLSASDIPLLPTVIFDLACITDAPGQQKTVFQMRSTTAKKAAIAYDTLFQSIIGGQY